MKQIVAMLLFTLSCAANVFAQDSVRISRFRKMQLAREQMHRERSAKRKNPDAEHRPRAAKFVRYYREDSATSAFFRNSLVVRITPASLLDFNGPCLPLGLEYRLSRSMAIAVDASVPMSYSMPSPVRNNSSGKTIHADLRLRVEVRKYFNKLGRRRAFFGVEGYVRHQQFSQTNGYYDGPSIFYVRSYAAADITKFHTGISPFIGSSVMLSNHLLFDAWFGIGLRYLENKYANVVGLVQGGRNSSGALFVPEDELYGHMWRPYITVGVKLGYKL